MNLLNKCKLPQGQRRSLKALAITQMKINSGSTWSHSKRNSEKWWDSGYILKYNNWISWCIQFREWKKKGIKIKLKILSYVTRGMKLALTELGKAEGRLDLGRMFRISLLDMWVWDIYQISKWSCSKDRRVYKSRVRERSLGWRYKLGSYKHIGNILNQDISIWKWQTERERERFTDRALRYSNIKRSRREKTRKETEKELTVRKK